MSAVAYSSCAKAVWTALAVSPSMKIRFSVPRSANGACFDSCCSERVLFSLLAQHIRQVLRAPRRRAPALLLEELHPQNICSRSSDVVLSHWLQAVRREGDSYILVGLTEDLISNVKRWPVILQCHLLLILVGDVIEPFFQPLKLIMVYYCSGEVINSYGLRLTTPLRCATQRTFGQVFTGLLLNQKWGYLDIWFRIRYCVALEVGHAEQNERGILDLCMWQVSLIWLFAIGNQQANAAWMKAQFMTQRQQ